MNKIQMIKTKSEERQLEFYNKMKPFLIIENYPIYKYAELLGVDKDSKTVLEEVRQSIYYVYRSIKTTINEEDQNKIAKNLKKMKNYETRVNLNDCSIGIMDKKTSKPIIKTPSKEEKKAALLYMYKNGEYFCEAVFRKTLRELIFKGTIDLDELSEYKKTLTPKDIDTIKSRMKIRTRLTNLFNIDITTSTTPASFNNRNIEILEKDWSKAKIFRMSNQ